jgi:hypothetical protein
MDNDTPVIEQILAILKEKHKQIDNLMTLTKEMEKVIDMNDAESLGAVLSMRQESMDRVDKMTAELREKLSEMDPLTKEKVIKLLTPAEEPLALYDPVETSIFETNRMTFTLLKKIIELDKAINKKVQQGAAPE